MNAAVTLRTRSGSVRLGPARSGRSAIEALLSPLQLLPVASHRCARNNSEKTSDPPPLPDGPTSVAMTSAGYSWSSKDEPQSVWCLPGLPLTSPTGLNVSYLMTRVMQSVTVKREITSVVTSSCADGRSAGNMIFHVQTFIMWLYRWVEGEITTAQPSTTL